MTAWNPYFAAYAAEHGRTPEEQLAHDRVEFPGGCMCGFILWSSARWREFRAARGMHRDEPTTDEHRAEYRRMVEARAAR